MKKLFIRLSVLCLTIAMVSCSKDDSSSQQTFTPKVSTIDLSKIAPAGMQDSAPGAYAMLSQMSGFMAMPAAYMHNPNGKTSSNTGTYTSGGYTITYSYGDDGTQYDFSFVGTNGQGQQCFSVAGWEYMDGTAGSWDYTINTAVLGDPNGGNYNVSFDWNTNNQGGYHFDMTFDMGDMDYHYVMNTYANYAGDIHIYSGNPLALTDTIVWTATGGTWTDANGEVTEWTN
ncbi:hypothetical protein [Flavobacterium sp. XGLA_31]|uniref:hypothetical protein n=1 Tax=Flavobacterium sp. XGLA_31 TaxID=3447666 RepID=UPI003F315785